MIISPGRTACIGFVRTGNAMHLGCAVVLSNKEDSQSFTESIRIYMQQDGKVHIDAEGWGTFSCFANHKQVWVPLEEV
ncbi:hypothetical protein LshimejAT787_0803010 [Lyophyllum shimeji]|uniref:Uncharacterized protein n=1 Tax=Lyophyllum shimeji TaxID=47721 RepID=A0A9P3PR09_LYOSH|nr:hypothetical protein LshimejAT787_0803010 [Lyophyllum shimeji]